MKCLKRHYEHKYHNVFFCLKLMLQNCYLNVMYNYVILAMVSIIPFTLLFFYVCGYLLNTIFTLFFGLCALYFVSKVQKKAIKGLIVFAFMVVSIIADAGVSGVLLIYLMGSIDDQRKACFYGITTLNVLDIAMTFLLGGLPAVLEIGFIGDIVATFAAIPLLISYNGNRGKSFKYFFYVFYPTHLLLLYGLRILIV